MLRSELFSYIYIVYCYSLLFSDCFFQNNVFFQRVLIAFPTCRQCLERARPLIGGKALRKVVCHGESLGVEG